MGKALLIIAPQDFREEELFDTKKALEEKGKECIIASKTKGTCTGKPEGKTAEATLALDEVKTDEFDAIVFIGGMGATIYQNDTTAHKIIKEAYEKGKIIAGICIAPTILANAGILKGKRATVWDSGDKKIATQIEEKGAIYTGENVTTDGKIITANGPHAAKEFGEKIAEMI
ncbi:DJ-1 family protein [Candidatus Woesearchaeota archaeon]|nr:MAG: DJ-1 family protein [Candidatus Woesearchaeota archaeon]